MKNNIEIKSNLSIIWDYLLLNQPLEKADCILVFGGHDPSVAIHAAKLFNEDWAPYIMISGGVTHPAKYYGNIEDMIEAEALKNIVVKNGVSEENIIIEPKATNTSENFWFVADLIKDKNLGFNNFILVQKPYTERRTFATGLKRWPTKKLLISSINMSLTEYIESGLPLEKIINMMVGEIQRIKEYPEKGYMIIQEIPERVWESHLYLKNLGYTKREIE